jgi:hypothetical protein
MLSMWIQLSDDRWGSENLVTRAVIRLEPPELEHLFEIHFAEDVDQLGTYDGALLQLSSGRHIGLIRWREWSESGTAVLIADESPAALEDFLGDLGIDGSDVTWRYGQDANDGQTTI